MYLLRSDECKECNVCMENCPISRDPSIQACKHCPDPPCVDACKYSAFYEVYPGIWGIDPNRCVGCGECAKACPYGAIVMEDGIAKKCILCGECLGSCPLNALKIVETEEEAKEKEKILGWKTLNSGTRLDIYRPSIQEARLLGIVLETYKDLASEPIELDTLFSRIIQEMGLELDKEQMLGLLELMKHEIQGFSVLDKLLEDENLEEIAVIEGEPIRVFHRERGWVDLDISITSREKLIDLANRMASSLDRRLTMQEPRMNASIPGGHRLHAVIPPVSDRASLTIRKFKRRPYSPRELAKNGTISLEALAYIWIVMQLNSNVLIAGSTGSGKTTTLNSILAFVPLNQRIVVIEETPELAIYHPHNIRLIVNRDRGIGMTELVEDTLRMRPDKIIVGEVRSPGEVKAWINTTLAGQGKGSLATFHSVTSREVVGRLASLGILEPEMSAIDLVIVQRRWTDYSTGSEIRRIWEIAEMDFNENVTVNPVFRYNPNEDRLVRTTYPSRLMKDAKVFLGIDAKKEIKRRMDFLSRTSPDFEKSMKEINRYMSGKMETAKIEMENSRRRR